MDSSTLIGLQIQQKQSPFASCFFPRVSRSSHHEVIENPSQETSDEKHAWYMNCLKASIVHTENQYQQHFRRDYFRHNGFDRTCGYDIAGSTTKHLSTVVAFVFSASHTTLFYVSAPVWSMILGTRRYKFIDEPMS